MWTNKFIGLTNCGGEFPLWIVEIPLGSRPLFDTRQRQASGKLIPLKLDLQENERNEREEIDRNPTLILMVFLSASFFVLDAWAPSAEVILQEIQKYLSSFYQNLLRKFIHIESCSINTNEMASHVKGNRPSYY